MQQRKKLPRDNSGSLGLPWASRAELSVTHSFNPSQRRRSRRTNHPLDQLGSLQISRRRRWLRFKRPVPLELLLFGRPNWLIMTQPIQPLDRERR